MDFLIYENVFIVVTSKTIWLPSASNKSNNFAFDLFELILTYLNVFPSLMCNLSTLICSNIQSKSERLLKDFSSYFVSVFQVKKTNPKTSQVEKKVWNSKGSVDIS